MTMGRLFKGKTADLQDRIIAPTPQEIFDYTEHDTSLFMGAVESLFGFTDKKNGVGRFFVDIYKGVDLLHPKAHPFPSHSSYVMTDLKRDVPTRDNIHYVALYFSDIDLTDKPEVFLSEKYRSKFAFLRSRTPIEDLDNNSDMIGLYISTGNSERNPWYYRQEAVLIKGSAVPKDKRALAKLIGEEQ